MATIVAVNAFLRGTGASFFSANLAALLAIRGEHVGLVDADLSAPTLHYLFGIDQEEIRATLNDVLLGQAAPIEASIDVTDRLPVTDAGRLFLMPATEDIRRATTTLLSEYELSQFSRSLHAIAAEYALDRILVDTPAGTAKETLSTFALCDQILAITTLDRREIKGSTIVVDLARELSVKQISAVLNKSGVSNDSGELQAQIRKAYNCDLAAVLPYADDVAALASGGLFVCENPDHPVAKRLEDIAKFIQ